MGSIMGGNVSVRRRRSLSTSQQRSMSTAHPMNTVFLPMEKIFLMIGREKMADTCPHRAESMAF
jgi:hypothetical protein